MLTKLIRALDEPLMTISELLIGHSDLRLEHLDVLKHIHRKLVNLPVLSHLLPVDLYLCMHAPNLKHEIHLRLLLLLVPELD